MAATRGSAPKQWNLSEEESLNSFNAWKDNLLYILSLNADFTPFLAQNATWATDATANRGYADDGDDVVVAANRLTAVQKAGRLRLMLGQIANFATIISRNQIILHSTSLASIWSNLREHYGFQCTGSRFLTLAAIKLNPAERPEHLYQRLVTFFDDNLITTDGLLHHGQHVNADEVVTPTLQNTIVLLWLERIHSGLPGLVQQKYGAELRNKSLASLKSEISLALQSLLNELEQGEDSRIMRAQATRYNSNNRFSANFNNRSQQQQSRKNCVLCEAARRPGAGTHYLSQCNYLPEAEKKRLSKIRYVEVDEEEDGELGIEHVDTEECSALIDAPPASITRRVQTRKSPILNCMYKHFPVRLCLDTGAESNLVSKRYATQTAMVIHPSRQGAVQADEKTPLEVVGEVKIKIVCGSHVFHLEALVTKIDIGDVIAGEPFLEDNDVAIRPARKQIIIKGRDIIPYQAEF